MKAVQITEFGGPEVLKVTEIEEPRDLEIEIEELREIIDILLGGESVE